MIRGDILSTSIEDKIALFSKVIFERIDDEFRQRRDVLLQHYEKEKASVNAEYQKKLNQAIQTVTKNAEIERHNIVSKAISAGRISILRRRQEFMERLIDLVKLRAKQFVKTEEYKDFLGWAVDQVSKNFDPDQMVIYNFTGRDLGSYNDFIFDSIKKLRYKNNFQIAEGGDDMIGGVFALSGDGRMEVDYTINTTIEESRPVIGRLLSSRCGEGCEKWVQLEI